LHLRQKLSIWNTRAERNPMTQEKDTAQIDSPSPKKPVQAKKPKNQKMKNQCHADKNGNPGGIEQHQWKQAFPQDKRPATP